MLRFVEDGLWREFLLEHDGMAVCRLTKQKLARIIEKGDYEITGYILRSKGEDGARCLIEDSCVRWTNNETFNRFMHPPQ